MLVSIMIIFKMFSILNNIFDKFIFRYEQDEYLDEEVKNHKKRLDEELEQCKKRLEQKQKMLDEELEQCKERLEQKQKRLDEDLENYKKQLKERTCLLYTSPSPRDRG